MVTIDIPRLYAASPSEGTPHLTINHKATLDLDSTNAFEGVLLKHDFLKQQSINCCLGPEKLLEVWFSPSPEEIPVSTARNGLKAVSAGIWKEMLDLVNCKVLSIVESEHVDAYLLSESSMFVFPHKLILKTCGTTTLLCGLPRILEIAALSAGFPHVQPNLLKGISAVATPYRIFYSRKNFLFPDRQHHPHRSWRDEVKFLDKMFLRGSAYMIGKMNGEHWYLYITDPGTTLTPPATPEPDQTSQGETKTRLLTMPADMAAAHTVGLDQGSDETLEVLMTDLDPENAKQFYLENASAVAEGQFYQRAHHTLRGGDGDSSGSSGNGLGNRISGHVNGHSQAAFDVFSNTGSDNGEFTSDVEGRYPEELTTEGHALGTVVSGSCGLSEVYPSSRYPDARIDAYLFTPCGFSANGVIPASEGAKDSNPTYYFTVHVTPEPHCSYASFETNVPSRKSGRETADVVEQVVKIFCPGRFSVTLFEAKVSDYERGLSRGYGSSTAEYKASEMSAAKRSARMDGIKGYRRVDRIVHDLDGYDLVFRYYERDDWKGGAPRLGERAP
ncbi:MAG: spermidine resistance protein [Geoglossum umbratile]|nr:MAG: spermidine resistance protein [Geoglossum umbratile]